MAEKTYTVAEAAELIGITPSSVRDSIQRGTLKARLYVPRGAPKNTRWYLIPQAEIERYRTEHHERPGFFHTPKITDPERVSVGEAARLLGVSKQRMSILHRKYPLDWDGKSMSRDLVMRFKAHRETVYLDESA